MLTIFLETPVTTGPVFLPYLRPPLDLTVLPCLASPPGHPFKPRRPPDRAQAAPAPHTPMIDTDVLRAPKRVLLLLIAIRLTLNLNPGGLLTSSKGEIVNGRKPCAFSITKKMQYEALN